MCSCVCIMCYCAHFKFQIYNYFSLLINCHGFRLEILVYFGNNWRKLLQIIRYFTTWCLDEYSSLHPDKLSNRRPFLLHDSTCLVYIRKPELATEVMPLCIIYTFYSSDLGRWIAGLWCKRERESKSISHCPSTGVQNFNAILYGDMMVWTRSGWCFLSIRFTLYWSLFLWQYPLLFLVFFYFLRISIMFFFLFTSFY